MHDPIFLAGKSEIATKEDLPIAQDLLDTLMAHKETCVGMAANMIGVKKRIIAFLDESGRAPVYTVMLNPEIIIAMMRMTPKKAVCRFSEIPANASGIKPSKCSIALSQCRQG